MEISKVAGRIFSFKCFVLFPESATQVCEINALERCGWAFSASPAWARRCWTVKETGKKSAVVLKHGKYLDLAQPLYRKTVLRRRWYAHSFWHLDVAFVLLPLLTMFIIFYWCSRISFSICNCWAFDELCNVVAAAIGKLNVEWTVGLYNSF